MSEQSSLISGPGLNSSPPEAKNPGIFCGSGTTFHQEPEVQLGSAITSNPASPAALPHSAGQHQPTI